MNKPQTPRAGAIQVLLMVDFPIVAWGLERLLESWRPQLALAGSADTCAEALRLQAQGAVDVVLVDIDGDHGAQTIRDLQLGSRAGILALTASRDSAVHDRAVLAGANGVIHKGDPVTILRKAIERIHAGEIWIDRKSAGRIFVELARRQTAPDPEQVKLACLTRKERKAVAELARDASASSREIAARLHISEHTLRNHLSSIYAKLHLSGRLELYAFANRLNLTEP